MKLTPKAKPIRIRIVSGGEEHSSLESLRKNFSPKDLIPLVRNEQLIKWLRQQHEEELAEKVSAFRLTLTDSDPDKDETLEFIFTFLPHYRKMEICKAIECWKRDEIEIYRYIKPIFHLFDSFEEAWTSYTHNPQMYSESTWREVFIRVLHEDSFKETVRVYQSKNTENLLTDVDWEHIFSNRKDIDDRDSFYILAKINDKLPAGGEKAKHFYDLSARLGNSKAKQHLADLPKLNLITQFQLNPSTFASKESFTSSDFSKSLKDEDLILFLNYLSRAYKTSKRISTQKINDCGKYSKYLYMVNVMCDREYVSYYHDATIDSLNNLIKKFAPFPAAESLIQLLQKSSAEKYRNYQDNIVMISDYVKKYEFV